MTANFTNQGLQQNYEVGLLSFEKKDRNTEVYRNLNERFTEFLRSDKKIIIVDKTTGKLDLR